MLKSIFSLFKKSTSVDKANEENSLYLQKLLKEVEGKGYRAENISASCKGCGLCASTCPQKAIDMLHFRDEQILASVCAIV